MASGRLKALKPQGPRLVAALVLVAVVVPAWLFFGPTQLGGSSTYSITEGISMQPLLKKGDLALVRSQSSYKVGQIVLYQSSTLHRPVLHRIIQIQNGHYFFKGDNNDFVDPGYATRSELSGKLWVHVQDVGTVLGWVGTPWHAAMLAGLTTMLLVLGGGAETRRRRRRRRGPVTAAPSAAATPAKRTRIRTPRYVDPMTKLTVVSIAVLTLVGFVLLGLGLGAPTKRIVADADAYRNAGTFSYRAKTLKASSSYPKGVAVTGQPLFAGLVNATTFKFKYQFISALPHDVHGTIVLKALILSQDSSWQNLYVVKAKASFTGDRAETGGLLGLNQLFGLLNELSTVSGTPGAEYSVDLQPVVHVVGTVDGEPINSTFAPALPFTATSLAVKLNVQAPVAAAGATYTPQTGVAALSTTLNPAQPGSIPAVASNHITVARYAIPVLVARFIGLAALAIAALLGIFHGRFLRRGSQRPIEERIANHFGLLVTPVDALAIPEGVVATPIPDFASLAALARYLERPILRRTDATGSTYSVDDEPRMYEYHALPVVLAEAGVVAPDPPAPQSAVVPRTRRGMPHSSRLIIAGAVVTVVIAVTLVTSFTASTNVPVSHTGVDRTTLAVSQEEPAGCASLSLSSVVIHAGSFTNHTSDALVLGDASAETITDAGTHNCIVGGGGKDTVDAVASDVCIIGPTTGATYNSCTKHS